MNDLSGNPSAIPYVLRIIYIHYNGSPFQIHVCIYAYCHASLYGISMISISLTDIDLSILFNHGGSSGIDFVQICGCGMKYLFRRGYILDFTGLTPVGISSTFITMNWTNI